MRGRQDSNLRTRDCGSPALAAGAPIPEGLRPGSAGCDHQISPASASRYRHPQRAAAESCELASVGCRHPLGQLGLPVAAPVHQPSAVSGSDGRPGRSPRSPASSACPCCRSPRKAEDDYAPWRQAHSSQRDWAKAILPLHHQRAGYPALQAPAPESRHHPCAGDEVSRRCAGIGDDSTTASRRAIDASGEIPKPSVILSSMNQDEKIRWH